MFTSTDHQADAGFGSPTHLDQAPARVVDPKLDDSNPAEVRVAALEGDRPATTLAPDLDREPVALRQAAGLPQGGPLVTFQSPMHRVVIVEGWPELEGPPMPFDRFVSEWIGSEASARVRASRDLESAEACSPEAWEAVRKERAARWLLGEAEHDANTAMDAVDVEAYVAALDKVRTFERSLAEADHAAALVFGEIAPQPETVAERQARRLEAAEAAGFTFARTGKEGDFEPQQKGRWAAVGQAIGISRQQAASEIRAALEQRERGSGEERPPVGGRRQSDAAPVSRTPSTGLLARCWTLPPSD